MNIIAEQIYMKYDFDKNWSSFINWTEAFEIRRSVYSALQAGLLTKIHESEFSLLRRICQGNHLLRFHTFSRHRDGNTAR